MGNSYQALETQLALLEYWHSEEALVEAQLLRLQVMAAHGSAPEVRALMTMMVHTLGAAETYFVTKEIANLLTDSLETLPDVPLGDALPECDVGFALVDGPIAVIGNERIFAFSWHRQGKRLVPLRNPSEIEEINVCFFGSAGLCSKSALCSQSRRAVPKVTRGATSVIPR
jgi:hypothetical protein